jgi:hypothetical protein
LFTGKATEEARRCARDQATRMPEVQALGESERRDQSSDNEQACEEVRDQRAADVRVNERADETRDRAYDAEPKQHVTIDRVSQLDRAHEASDEVRHGRDRDGHLQVHTQREQRNENAPDPCARDGRKPAAEHTRHEHDR